MTQPAVEIETKLKSDAALKSLSELRKAIKEDLTESMSLAKVSSKDLSKELIGGFTSALNPLALVAAGVAGVGAAFSGLISITKESISAAMEAEAIEMRVARSLQLRGQYTSESFEALKEFNDQLERTTTLDADQVLQAQGTLSSMGVLREDLKKVTLAAVGLSEEFGIDLPQATKEMGQAIVENREVLRKYGVDAKSAEEIIARFAPSAQLAAEKMELLSGVLEANKIAWGNLSETFGTIFTQSDAIKGGVDGITGSVRELTDVVKLAQPIFTRTFDGMVRVLGSALPGRSLLDLYTGADLNFSTPIIEPDKDKVKTQNRKDAPQVLYTQVDEALQKRLAEEAEKLRKKYEQEVQDMISGKRGGRGRGAAEQKEKEEAIEASFQAFLVAEAAAREAEILVNTANFEKRAARRLTSVTTDPNTGNLVPTYASREGEQMAEEFKFQQALENNARLQTVEDQRLQFEMDLAFARADLQKKEEEQLRAHYGQLSAITIQGTSAMIGTLIATTVASGKIDWGGMFGGLLVSVGQAALAMGTAGLAAATLGSVAKWLAPATGGPAGIGPSLALMAAGAGAIAAGTALGASGKGSVGATVGGPGGNVGGTGGFVPSSPSTPLGFQPPPNAPREPQATVINVSFQGLMSGSERGLAREIGRVLRSGATLAPGG